MRTKKHYLKMAEYYLEFVNDDSKFTDNRLTYVKLAEINIQMANALPEEKSYEKNEKSYKETNHDL